MQCWGPGNLGQLGDTLGVDPASRLGAGGSNEVTVLLGTGTGVFEDPLVYEVPSDARAIAAGDLNGDGIADLVVSHGGQDLLSLLLSDA